MSRPSNINDIIDVMKQELETITCAIDFMCEEKVSLFKIDKKTLYFGVIEHGGRYYMKEFDRGYTNVLRDYDIQEIPFDITLTVPVSDNQYGIPAMKYNIGNKADLTKTDKKMPTGQVSSAPPDFDPAGAGWFEVENWGHILVATDEDTGCACVISRYYESLFRNKTANSDGRLFDYQDNGQVEVTHDGKKFKFNIVSCRYSPPVSQTP